jgi:hypothetical protein
LERNFILITIYYEITEQSSHLEKIIKFREAFQNQVVDDFLYIILSNQIGIIPPNILEYSLRWELSRLWIIIGPSWGRIRGRFRFVNLGELTD